MRHAFIDTYANLNTPLHSCDARVKVVLLLSFLLLIIFTPVKFVLLFLLYFLIISTLVSLSKIPLAFILKRILEIMPFVVLISISALFTKQGYILFLNCTLKAILAVVLILLISSTTKFSRLLGALEYFRAPAIFVHLLSFLYRYSFLLEDQLLKAGRARESRSTGKSDSFRKVKILSNILGVTFIRTYERAERLYLAMRARGYNHEKIS